MVQFNTREVLRVLQKYELPRMMTDLKWLPRIGDNWAENEDISPTWTFSSVFLDKRALKRITKSSFWLKFNSPRVFPIVYPHHLPLELRHMLWGDMETRCPDLPSGTHCPAAGNAASEQLKLPALHGGIKAWSLHVSGQPWKDIFTPDPHGVSSGHLASDAAWSFPLPYPVSSLLIPQCWPQGQPWYTSQH